MFSHFFLHLHKSGRLDHLRQVFDQIIWICIFCTEKHPYFRFEHDYVYHVAKLHGGLLPALINLHNERSAGSMQDVIDNLAQFDQMFLISYNEFKKGPTGCTKAKLDTLNSLCGLNFEFRIK